MFKSWLVWTKESWKMSEKVLGGRGHKISPGGRGSIIGAKIAYSPCPKFDQDLPEMNGLRLPLATPNGNKSKYT